MLSNQYIAGFIDGEGCINFGRSGKNQLLHPRILITHTDYSILQEFKEQFGGDIHELKHGRTNWKRAYQWRLGWARAVDFLEDIYDHLKLKREQALTVFAWAAVKKAWGADAKILSWLKARMHKLNKKGVRRGKKK